MGGGVGDGVGKDAFCTSPPNCSKKAVKLLAIDCPSTSPLKVMLIVVSPFITNKVGLKVGRREGAPEGSAVG